MTTLAQLDAFDLLVEIWSTDVDDKYANIAKVMGCSEELTEIRESMLELIKMRREIFFDRNAPESRIA